MQSEHLPLGWAISSIGEIADKCSQRKPMDDEQFFYVDIGSIDRERKTISEPQRLLGTDAPSRARKEVNSGDILVSLTRPNLNAVALVGDEFDGQIASTGFEVLKPILAESRYLFAIVRSRDFIDSITGKVQGALYPAAKAGDVREFKIPFPPLAEQKQIAVKLDELLAQVDTIKTRLDAIPAILKLFRQSVLTVAVSGRLTEKWRGENQITPPSRTWPSLEVIECEADFPEEWEGVSLGSVSMRVSVGHVGKTSEFYTDKEHGIPFLRSQNVRPGKVSLDGLAYITPEFHSSLKKSQLRPGDLLVVRVGANRGDACVLPEFFEQVNCANIVFARPLDGLSDYLDLYFQSSKARDLLLGQSVGGAQGVINTKSVAEVFLALPPIEEQTEIVRRVEQLFIFADQIEQRVKDAQSRVNHLSQSVLAKAFRGELTAEWREQNPDLITGENSAEALLARIQEQRANVVKPKRSQTRATSKPKGDKSAMIIPILEALQKQGKPLDAQTLLAEAGYSKDAGTEDVERFMLDIRDMLDQGKIHRKRVGDKDVFSLSE